MLYFETWNKYNRFCVWINIIIITETWGYSLRPAAKATIATHTTVSNILAATKICLLLASANKFSYISRRLNTLFSTWKLKSAHNFAWFNFRDFSSLVFARFQNQRNYFILYLIVRDTKCKKNEIHANLTDKFYAKIEAREYVRFYSC